MMAQQTSLKVNKGGRPKTPDVPREPSGRVSRSAPNDPPVEALMHRASESGMVDPPKPGTLAARALCADAQAGRALGHLMWRHTPDGKRVRRMMGQTDTPIITDEMAVAADAYAHAWDAWRRAQGFARPHPKASAVERTAPGPEPDMADDRVRRLCARYNKARAVMKRCDGAALVCAVVDAVILDNEPCPLLTKPEYGRALKALRDGLTAIYAAIIDTRVAA